MADLTHIAFLLEEERLRKEDLGRKLSIGEISMKEYIDNLCTTDQEILEHFKGESDPEIANNISSIPFLDNKPMTPELFHKNHFGSMYYKKTLFDEYVNSLMQQPIDQYRPAGYVRAPKFGVKHKINL